MISYSIYIVDDEELIRDASVLTLGKKYRVKAFSSAESAIDALRTDPPDLVLLDIGLPGMSGIEAIEAIKAKCPDVLIIMITAYDDIETVISAMKRGAYDYVVKPINMDALELGIANALETIRLRKEVQLLQEKYLKENLPYFIGQSDAIVDIMALVTTVAKSPHASVLILGDTGTGKELIASTIHYKSPHFRGPFVTLNCAAIPENLVESELFGYEKGAFSGAAPGGKQGLLEAAADGTLFLDEVGDLSLGIQAKLLRFLENGEYYKVGGTQKKSIRTRVVAATNRDLDALIANGQFRQDLYYRLAIIKIEVPTLSRRREDILPMAMHFLVEFSQKLNKPIAGISPDAQTVLQAMEWKGNVRELRNRIERGVLIGKGPEITLNDLGLDNPDRSTMVALNAPKGVAASGAGFPMLSADGIDLPGLHEAMDRHYFDQSLKMADGNATQAARLLQMSYYAFRRRIDKLKIKPKTPSLKKTIG